MEDNNNDSNNANATTATTATALRTTTVKMEMEIPLPASSTSASIESSEGHNGHGTQWQRRTISHDSVAAPFDSSSQQQQQPSSQDNDNRIPAQTIAASSSPSPSSTSTTSSSIDLSTAVGNQQQVQVSVSTPGLALSIDTSTATVPLNQIYALAANGSDLAVGSCDRCRRLHSSCVGRPSCSNCIKRGVKCIFTPRKKPGPPRGSKRTRLNPQGRNSTSPDNDADEPLHDEFASEKLVSYWRPYTRYLKTFRTYWKDDVLCKFNFESEVPSLDFLLPLCMTAPEGRVKNIKLLSFLGLGATVLKHGNEAQFLADVAFQLCNRFFEVEDLDKIENENLCTMLTAVAHLNQVIGRNDRSQSSAAKCYSILRKITAAQERHRVEGEEGPAPVYESSSPPMVTQSVAWLMAHNFTMTMATLKPEDRESYRELLSKYTNFDPALRLWVIGGSIFVEVIEATCSTDIKQYDPTQLFKLISEGDDLILFLKSHPSYANSELWECYSANFLGLKATLSWLCGCQESAIDMADKATVRILNCLEMNTHVTIGMLVVLSFLGKIHIQSGNMELFDRCLKVLSEGAEQFPTFVPFYMGLKDADADSKWFPALWKQYTSVMSNSIRLAAPTATEPSAEGDAAGGEAMDEADENETVSASTSYENVLSPISADPLYHSQHQLHHSHSDLPTPSSYSQGEHPTLSSTPSTSQHKRQRQPQQRQKPPSQSTTASQSVPTSVSATTSTQTTNGHLPTTPTSSQFQHPPDPTMCYFDFLAASSPYQSLPILQQQPLHSQAVPIGYSPSQELASSSGGDFFGSINTTMSASLVMASQPFQMMLPGTPLITTSAPKGISSLSYDPMKALNLENLGSQSFATASSPEFESEWWVSSSD